MNLRGGRLLAPPPQKELKNDVDIKKTTSVTYHKPLVTCHKPTVKYHKLLVTCQKTPVTCHKPYMT